ncbi:MAG: flavodoxin family protein, partial [Oscillospiraceae bacterium]|nr:flavodoxin family protein [Oscillospiraceae bacterium]
MKKVLIVSTSPRINSNSEALAKAFAKGVQEAGHEAELISLRGKTINFCRGCFDCQEKQRCVIRDDADEIC